MTDWQIDSRHRVCRRQVLQYTLPVLVGGHLRSKDRLFTGYWRIFISRASITAWNTMDISAFLTITGQA